MLQVLAKEASDSTFIICRGAGSRLIGDSSARAALLATQEKLKSQIPQPMTCQGLQEGGVLGTQYEGFHDVPIHVRGSYERLATVQPRRFPTVLVSQIPEIEGSGRLQLADWIASTDNPLTARVMTNRIWQHHFQRGIVGTTNNFGKLGTPPTHPKLLDWLAVTFMESGWSIKEMHRLICTSSTYQQSAFPDATTLERDPDNLLFSRQVRRKLTAEELRDSLLAVTGELDLTLGGPAVPKLEVPRRTLYLRTVRSDRTSYQLLFDGADPTTIIEQRNESLVAPQALWLMNQPFLLERARRLSQRIQSRSDLDREGKLNVLFEELYARTIQPAEIAVLSRFLEQEDDSAGSWETLCHILLCSNEFIFLD